MVSIASTSVCWCPVALMTLSLACLLAVLAENSLKSALMIRRSLAFLDGLDGAALVAGRFPLKVAVEARREVHEEGVGLEEDAVTRSGHNRGDLARGLDSAQFEESRGGCEGLTKESGSLGFTLSLDDGGALILDCLVDQVLGTLSLLLGDLLLFDGLGELGAEMQISDGDIIEHDVEVAQSLGQAVANLLGDLLSLGQELGGVVAGDHRLEHLIDDGGEHAAIVVRTQESVQLEELRGVGAE
mmetsp:Transcript_20743/g.28004  ORF Transcript_20743/g.28004 Transcript_20743/m.28004 type:complete len:243 (+) Transcript_20743:313-1041(+)